MSIHAAIDTAKAAPVAQARVEPPKAPAVDWARTVRIPMAPGFDSLNVATAAAIALHRLA